MAAGSVYIDTNGNQRFDPENPDFVNRDIVYTLGFASDFIFAGNFRNPVTGIADGFDKLAAYSRIGTAISPTYRFLVDTDNNGVPDVTSYRCAASNKHPAVYFLARLCA